MGVLIVIDAFLVFFVNIVMIAPTVSGVMIVKTVSIVLIVMVWKIKNIVLRMSNLHQKNLLKELWHNMSIV